MIEDDDDRLSHQEIAARFRRMAGSLDVAWAECYFEAGASMVQRMVSLGAPEHAEQIAVGLGRTARALHPELRDRRSWSDDAALTTG